MDQMPPQDQPQSAAATAKDALVLFMPSGRRGRFPIGMPVLDAARSLGVYIESVCGGRGMCGRCQVEVAEGVFAKHAIVSRADHLGPAVRDRGTLPPPRHPGAGAAAVLLGAIQGDLVIDVPMDVADQPPDRAQARRNPRDRARSGDAAVTRRACRRARHGTSRSAIADRLHRRARAATGDVGAAVARPAAARHLQRMLRAGEWKVTAAVHHGQRARRW